MTLRVAFDVTSLLEARTGVGREREIEQRRGDAEMRAPDEARRRDRAGERLRGKILARGQEPPGEGLQLRAQ